MERAGTSNGGNCLVSWERVHRPLEFGGLGIHNLEKLGWALRIRWLWAQKTDSSRPWVMWNLVSVRLEIVLVLVQDRCTVCATRTIGSDIF